MTIIRSLLEEYQNDLDQLLSSLRRQLSNNECSLSTEQLAQIYKILSLFSYVLSAEQENIEFDI